MKLLLKIGVGVIVFLVVALIAFNMLISASAVRDRVAARIKEQTGRELTVNGSTSLLLMPSPHIVLTDVEIVDPQNHAGADLKVDRLVLDVSFSQLFSRQVDAKRVVMERPEFTVRLKQQAAAIEPQENADAPPEQRAEAQLRFIAADAAGVRRHRTDIVLERDLRGLWCRHDYRLLDAAMKAEKRWRVSFPARDTGSRTPLCRRRRVRGAGWRAGAAPLKLLLL